MYEIRYWDDAMAYLWNCGAQERVRLNEGIHEHLPIGPIPPNPCEIEELPGGGYRAFVEHHQVLYTQDDEKEIINVYCLKRSGG